MIDEIYRIAGVCGGGEIQQASYDLFQKWKLCQNFVCLPILEYVAYNRTHKLS